MAQSLSKKDLLNIFDEIKQEQAADFPLTELFLKRYFKPLVFKKAKSHFADGLVNWVEADDGFHKISSEVQNDQGDVFHQQIQIKQLRTGYSLSAHCSCNIAKKCYHIAAVILKLKTEHSGEFGQHFLVHDWFNELEKLKVHHRVFKKDVILFTLEATEQGLVVIPKQAPYSGSERYSLGRTLTKQQINSSVTPDNINEEDFRLLSWIRSQNTFGQLHLDGRWGSFALIKMIDTGRCFWETSRDPLTLADKRTISLKWQTIDNSHQLDIDLALSDNWQLFNTIPPYYIDATNNKVGELNTALSSQEITHLLKMPAVSSDIFEQVNKQFNRMFGPGLIKHTSEEMFTSHSGVKIKPHLSLLVENNEVMFKFEFLYGRTFVQLKDPDNHIRIVRQLSYEDTCVNRLYNFGLQSTKGPDKNACYLSFPTSDQKDVDIHWFVNEIVPGLIKEGWKVPNLDYNDKVIIKPQLILSVARDRVNKISITPSCEVDNKPIFLNAILTQGALANSKSANFNYYSHSAGQWLAFQKTDLLLLTNLIEEFYANKKIPKRLLLPLSYAGYLSQFEHAKIDCNDSVLIELGKTDCKTVSTHQFVAPKGLKAKLRDYQKQGVVWLQFLKKYKLGGILADDMGLGKTLQTIAFLLSEKMANGLSAPALIVCPTSLVTNWMNELTKFSPDLKIVVSHGANRQSVFDLLPKADCVITTYPLITRDNSIYQSMKFSNVILDEAQVIKNNQAKISRAVKNIQSDFNLCLTGTPVENNLMELKSLLDFAMPGLVGSTAHFKTHYQIPIEKENDEIKAKALKRLTAPFMLRRTKEQVVTELPAKTELVKMIELLPKQQNHYAQVRANMEHKMRSVFEAQGVERSRLEFLEALLRLRQVCCDPRLASEDQSLLDSDSAKLDWLATNLPVMLLEGRKIIIFSQFTSMLKIIENALAVMNIQYSLLTGQTRDRQAAVDEFQNGDNPVFLISLKAGGTGLNLTKADTVIHYDPWWNPAVEKQATDRAHRIGQKKAVFVYKLICENTIEERVYKMQKDKEALADSFFDASNNQFKVHSAAEMMALLTTDHL